MLLAEDNGVGSPNMSMMEEEEKKEIEFEGNAGIAKGEEIKSLHEESKKYQKGYKSSLDDGIVSATSGKPISNRIN